MSNNACDGDQLGVRHYHLTANQASGEATVTVDLRKGRDIDVQFDRLVARYGLREAIETWQAWDNEYTFKDGLLSLWVDGVTQKAMAGLTSLKPRQISDMLRPLKYEYFKRCEKNHAKIEAILKREDPEYDYMVYQKTVVNELCALLMGGDEIKDVLEQLSNWSNGSNTKGNTENDTH